MDPKKPGALSVFEIFASTRTASPESAQSLPIPVPVVRQNVASPPDADVALQEGIAFLEAKVSDQSSSDT